MPDGVLFAICSVVIIGAVVFGEQMETALIRFYLWLGDDDDE